MFSKGSEIERLSLLLIHRLLITSDFPCFPPCCHASPLPCSMASLEQASHLGPIPRASPFSSALVCGGSLAHPEAEGRGLLQFCSLLPCLAGAGVSSDPSCCWSRLPVQHRTRATSIPRGETWVLSLQTVTCRHFVLQHYPARGPLPRSRAVADGSCQIAE